MSSSEYTYNAPQFYSNLTEVVTISEDEDDFFDAKEVKEKDGAAVDPHIDISDDKENVILLTDSEEESLNDSFSKIKIKSKFDGIDLSVSSDRKSHPMLTRQDITILTPKHSLELRSRSVLKEVGVSHDAPEPRAANKRKAEDHPGQACVAKYRSLAESIYHFHKDTPPRFRGVSKKHSGLRLSTAPTLNPTVTVPETPHFISDQRLRHCTHHCLTQEERELQEIEEAKQQFKPQHLNKKIFEPPKEVDREKHFTVPKPFKFTKPPKKQVEEPKSEVFVFKAKPLPQSIYRDSLRVSTNRLPVLMEECEEKDAAVHGYIEAVSTTSTKIQPFSFDERDKLRAIRKKEKIEKIIESEKKVAVFKAQPLPSYISDAHSSTSSTCSSHHRHEMEDFHHEFKARPATVLQKKPLQVKRSDKGPTKVLDVTLNTEIRAKQRQAFDQQRRINQALTDQIEAKFEEEEELKAQAEVARLRKEMIHKPLAVPKAVRSSNKSSSESLNQHSDS